MKEKKAIIILKFGTIILVSLFSFQAYSQTNDTLKSNFVSLIVEEEPHFPKLSKYIQKHSNYPKQAVKDRIEGIVFIAFTIDEVGKVDNVKLEKGLRKDLNEVALKTIKNMPNWYPARLNGKPIRREMTLPITFTLKK